MIGYRTVTKPLPRIAPTKTSPIINKKLIKASSKELLVERSNVSTAKADIVVKLPINPVPINGIHVASIACKFNNANTARAPNMNSNIIPSITPSTGFSSRAKPMIRAMPKPRNITMAAFAIITC